MGGSGIGAGGGGGLGRLIDAKGIVGKAGLGSAKERDHKAREVGAEKRGWREDGLELSRKRFRELG